MDDGVREIHGVAIGSGVKLSEDKGGFWITVQVGIADTAINPASARYLARQLNRLARRSEERNPS